MARKYYINCKTGMIVEDDYIGWGIVVAERNSVPNRAFYHLDMYSSKLIEYTRACKIPVILKIKRRILRTLRKLRKFV